METIVVIDFETTGLSPGLGARATEIGAVLIRDGRIVDRFASLMNAGVPVPYYIEQLTGITNAMVRRAPPAAEVMRRVAAFVADSPLAAHNAAFDRKFWDNELEPICEQVQAWPHPEFVCSMRVARRVYPEASSHSLGALVDYVGVPVSGRFHRALADAEMTAQLLLRMQAQLADRYRLDTVPHRLLRSIQRAPRNSMDACVERFRRQADF